MATAPSRRDEAHDEAAPETTTAAPDAAPAQKKPGGLWREYFESIAVVFIMVLFFTTFVAQAAEVPSASMENTIYVGDHFLINKFIFAPGPHLSLLPQRDIRRGDIIVFKYPSEIGTNQEVVRYQTLFIKRVIGLPGETIEVRGPDVLIDGKVIPELRVETLDRELGNDKAELKKLVAPQTDGKAPYAVFYTPETLAAARRGASFAPPDFKFAVGKPFRIPEGEYFVMGDNRDNSLDSRAWGTVPRDLIVGRAMFVIWSYDKSAPQSPGPFGFLLDFFKHTRWSRTGTLLK